MEFFKKMTSFFNLFKLNKNVESKIDQKIEAAEASIKTQASDIQEPTNESISVETPIVETPIVEPQKTVESKIVTHEKPEVKEAVKETVKDIKAQTKKAVDGGQKPKSKKPRRKPKNKQEDNK